MPTPHHVLVAPAIPLPASGRQTFTYHLPAQTPAARGSVVTIPFGKRRITGVVTKIQEQSPTFLTKAASLRHLTLTDSQMELAQWIAATAHGSLGFTLRLFLPPRLSRDSDGARVPPKKPSQKTQLPALLKAPLSFAISEPARRRRQLRRLMQKILSHQAGQIVIVVPEKRLLAAWPEFPHLHAALPAKQRTALWFGAQAGTLRVVVGTQKALFLPFRNLRLVIVDEEALPTHKLWDQYPRLDNRDGARRLAALHGASLLRSGSFPSLAAHKAVLHDHLPARIYRPPRLRVSVFPVRSADRAQKNLLPIDFMEVVKMWVIQKRKTLLLLNQTGKQVQAIRSLLHHTLGPAIKHLTVATSAIFGEEDSSTFARAAWLFPEYTFTYPDFRSSEHGLITLARLQQLLPAKQAIAIVTRDIMLGHQLESVDAAAWYEALVAERQLLHLPPFTEAILLTIRDQKHRAALARARSVRAELEKRLQEAKNSARIQGPFKALTAAPPFKEYRLLLLGVAEQLAPLYHDLPVDRAELSPHRIL